jgi:hypothetical protein
MKHSQLKQLIREELKKALSRNEYEMGETILWKGSRVEVVEDEGGPTLKVELSNGNIKMVFRKDTSLPLNESPYPLTMRKDIIANAIDSNNIPEEAFAPQRSKDVVVSFIRDGRPSEVYLKKMMDILKKNGIEVEFPPLKPSPSPKPNISVDIDPYTTSAGKPSRDGYTGD